MAALRNLSAAFRPVASTSASVFARFPATAAARCAHQRRSYASEAEAPSRPPALKEYVATTVEELHNQSAQEALATAGAFTDWIMHDHGTDMCILGVYQDKGSMRHFTGEL